MNHSVLWYRFWIIEINVFVQSESIVLSLENLVARDFEKVAGTAIYYLPHHYMSFCKNYWESSQRVTWQ